jgi:hypothetical protein
MKQLLSAILLAFAMLPSLASACSCIGVEEPNAARKAADLVFVGRVTDVETFGLPIDAEFGNNGDSVFFNRITVQVDRRLKNGFLRRQFELVTGIGGGDCGFPFFVGKEYFVYGHWRNQLLNDGPKMRRFLWTDICTRTTDQIEGELVALGIRK